MTAKNREHLALVIVAEVKETIPRQNAVEPAIKGERTHVRGEPVLVGKMVPAHPDERRRRVHSGHDATLIDEVARDWLAGAASQVENRSPRRQERQHLVEPGFLEEAPPSFAIPIQCVSFI